MKLKTANNILTALAAFLLAGGALGWIWLGDWRFAATALVLLFVVALIGGRINPRTEK